MMAASIIEDVQQLHAFLEAQKSMLGGSFPNVRHAQCSNLVRRIADLQLGFADAAALSNELRKGPWTDDELHAMGTALARASEQVGTRTVKRSTQRMKNLPAYLTGTQATFLRSGRPVIEKVHYLADVMVRMGLVLPAEQTFGHAASMLRHLGASELADGNQFLTAVTELKRTLRSLCKNLPRGQWHLESWPDSPVDLPNDVRASIWPAGQEQPVGSNPGDLMMGAAGPLRKTSRQRPRLLNRGLIQRQACSSFGSNSWRP